MPTWHSGPWRRAKTTTGVGHHPILADPAEIMSQRGGRDTTPVVVRLERSWPLRWQQCWEQSHAAVTELITGRELLVSEPRATSIPRGVACLWDG